MNEKQKDTKMDKVTYDTFQHFNNSWECECKFNTDDITLMCAECQANLCDDEPEEE